MTSPVVSDSVAMAQFMDSRNRAKEYPENLVRTESFGHGLESYRKRLGDGKVFHPVYREMRWIELFEGSQEFTMFNCKDLTTAEKMSRYIDEEDSSPLWRMVFIQSSTARGPLGCTREQLTLLLTHYQVMPSFLDFVLTFKNRTQQPVGHALFRSENYLDKDSPAFSLPEIGRSGVSIQHAFNLLSVERSCDPNEKNQWPLRQVAIYHSFDVRNGRSVWISLKGNSLIAQRIWLATKKHRCLKATAITAPGSSFKASLQVHMMIMEWCTENWAEYIDRLEEELSPSFAAPKVMPVEDATSSKQMANTFSRGSTFQSNMSRQNTFENQSQNQSQSSSPPVSPKQRTTFRRSSSDIMSMFRRVSGSRSRPSKIFPDDDIEAAAGTIAEEVGESDGMNLAELEKEISFQGFQRLSLLGDEMEQGILVLDQNKGVLKAIEEHYRSIIDSFAFKTYLKSDSCDADVANFFRRIHSIDRDLDIHSSRLKALSRALENNKLMFSAMLQYKSEKTSEFFAKSAMSSSDRMEEMTNKMHKIAVRTEQETVSMHVITIFTLIFLPGTFIAVRFGLPLLQAILTRFQTFFSSGVLNWNDNGSMSSDWAARPEALKLFLEISFPLMVIIVAAWFLIYLCVRRKKPGVLQESLPLAELSGGHESEKEKQVQITVDVCSRAFLAGGPKLS